MITLRLYPFHLDKSRLKVEKYQIRIKRLKALAFALPTSKKILYYSSDLKDRAEEIADIFGNVELKLLSDLDIYDQDEVRIIVDRPEELARALYEKTGQIIDFENQRAVLSKTNIKGEESIIWALHPKDWIFLAYPEETLDFSRQENLLSLKELSLATIEESYNNILNKLETFLLAPSDPKSVHQYRISIRSFRALVSLFKPILDLQDYLKIQEIFRLKAREVELLREIDVLIEEWDKLRTAEEIYLRKSLANIRRDEENKIVEKLSRNKTREDLSTGLELLLDNLNETAWAHQRGIYYLDERLRDWYRSVMETLWGMEDFNLSYIHMIRLKSKKYRYISELFHEYLSDIQIARHKISKKRQGVLGQVCDSIRNQEAVRELMDKFDPVALREAEKFIHLEKEREKSLTSS